MPSTNKTANLNLNSWISTDKPKMEDFVNDNLLLDQVITDHVEDENLHITNEIRQKIENSFEYYILSGNGAATRTYTFTFNPKFVIYYANNMPFNFYDKENEYNVCCGGISYSGMSGSSPGIFLNNNQLMLYQSQSTPNDGIFLNLNKDGQAYTIVAFK